MIVATKLKNGTNFAEDGVPYKVIDYKHTHKSRGGGTVRVKVRNLLDGRMSTKTYQSTVKVDEIDVHKRLLQYLYRDGESYVFMHPETFEQIEVNESVVAEQGKYLKDGENAEVMFWDRGEDEMALGLSLPPKMTFEVEDAAPGEKGDSASNVYKDATLSNGLRVRVPLFINKGDMVRVDTRSGEYVERA